MAQARRSLAPLTGVVFVVLLVVAFTISGEGPMTDASQQEIVSFYSDNDAKVIGGAILFGWGAVFFLFFTGSLRSVLRSAEGSTGWLSAVAFGGGVVAAGGMLISAGLGFTLADAADNVDPTALQAINALVANLFLPLGAGLTTMLFATGLVVVRTKALPVWLGWAALVLAVAEFTPIGFFAFLASLLWVFVTSILMTRGGSAAPASSP